MSFRGFGSVPGELGSEVPAFAILIAALFFVTALLPAVDEASADEGGTRALPGYTVSVDGDGSNGAICLAGARFYDFTFAFTNSPKADLNHINFSKVNTDPPLLSTPIFAYSVANDTAFPLSDMAIALGDHELVTNTTHIVSFRISILFRMSWAEETGIEIVPSYLDYGIRRDDLQAQERRQVEIWGMLDKPKVGMILDEVGAEIGNNDIIRSNSTIRITGVSFSYWHSTEDFSAISPLHSELNPFIDDGYGVIEHEIGTSYNFSVLSPNLPDAKWELTLGVLGMNQADWAKRVGLWTISLQLDGLGPAFDLKAPMGKIGQGIVNWTVSLVEKPSTTSHLVDGETLSVRLGFDNGTWSQWTVSGTPIIGRSVEVRGSSVMTRSGYTRIQFSAEDILGNRAESVPYSIELNYPPSLSIPPQYRNRTYLTNQSIEMDGIDFATDEDDSVNVLIYNWQFDGEVIGKTKEISKPLFVESEGIHNITLTVYDGYMGSDTISFTVLIKKPSTEKEAPFLERMLEDPVFRVLASSILAIIVIVLISILIIVVVRRLGKREGDDDDFIISEDAGRDSEEIARKLHEMYSGNFVSVGADGSATAYEDMSGEEFDFDYNLYEILGLENNASEDAIKSAYRKLAGYYHPDRIAHNKDVDINEANEIMLRVNKAKEFLLNPERKARYDEHLSELDFSIET